MAYKLVFRTVVGLCIVAWAITLFAVGAWTERMLGIPLRDLTLLFVMSVGLLSGATLLACILDSLERTSRAKEGEVK